MLAASGTALLLAHNQSVSVSYDTGFTDLGQGDWLEFPIPAWIALAAYALRRSCCSTGCRSGRRILAVGGNEEASRLMGLSGTLREVLGLCAVRPLSPALPGMILAAQFGAGQPTEGVGWELFSIAAVVVGGHAC